MNFLEETNGGAWSKVSRFFRAFSSRMENKFVIELAMASKFILRNAHEIRIPLLWLEFSDSDPQIQQHVQRNHQFFNALQQHPDTAKISYGEPMREELSQDIKKVLCDMAGWCEKYECKNFDEDCDPHSCWSWLPQELKTLIFSFLGNNSIVKAATVCKSWRNLGYISLQDMDLSKTKFQPYLVRHIICYPFLQSLSLRSWLQITDKEVETITVRLTNLRDFNLSGCWQITDQSVFLIATNCKKLQSVTFDSCPKITNQGLIVLSENCQQLSSLHLSKCTQINSDGLDALADFCPKVCELNLSYFKLSSIQQALQRFFYLRVLYLEGRLLRTSDDSDPDDSKGISCFIAHSIFNFLLLIISSSFETANLGKLFKYLPNLEFISLKENVKLSARVKEKIRKHCLNLKELNY